jgi:hypothetical protein
VGEDELGSDGEARGGAARRREAGGHGHGGQAQDRGQGDPIDQAEVGGALAALQGQAAQGQGPAVVREGGDGRGRAEDRFPAFEESGGLGGEAGVGLVGGQPVAVAGGGAQDPAG